MIVEETKVQEKKVKAPRPPRKAKAVAAEIKPDENWNIKFVGKERLTNGEFRHLDPPSGSIPNGSNPIKLPGKEKQKIGFYHKQASLIVAMYPDLYKLRRDIAELKEGIPVRKARTIIK